MTEITPVGHWQKDDCSVYCGRHRTDELRHMHNTPIGERGWLGNPFTLDDYDRADAISRFRGDFEERLSHDREFANAVGDLKGQTLGCWCRQIDEQFPVCHCDIISEWADRLGDQSDKFGHNLVAKSCPEGQHDLVSGEVPGVFVCQRCELGLTTLTDQLGHYPLNGDKL